MNITPAQAEAIKRFREWQQEEFKRIGAIIEAAMEEKKKEKGKGKK